MKQFVLDYLANELSNSTRVANFLRTSDSADLLVTLADGKKIGLCVINRAIRLTEIRDRYACNTKQRIYTLYIMDGRMMPGDSTEVAPPQWMSALHTLTNGRVYAYWCEGRDVSIRPFHMEWKWGGSPRSVEYGDEIDVNSVRGEFLQTATKDIDGEFAAAYFGEGAFWKQRQAGEETQFNYSWRNWSYGGARRSTASETAEESWESWEEFERKYEPNTSGGWDWSGQPPRQPPRKENREAGYYAILGIPATASIDEVKQAYRRMARAYHPDMHPSEKEKYTAKMADINTAFEAIMKAQRT